ncbi:MAG TPA: tol-pal system protein YbgF [Candidatus Hydrogenedentes bacterium]|jgi:tol-pal system protein YbgF|nr:MAG: tol-pal system protein YbgF [Candidatus Hydrogenedentes bacterium ADurb.Bin170]HNZ47939.1 tol-pal system protein YbgF [Candidatus Hydrogenedentota bacterium]HOD95440.1 tol-pal system protein YbgF [Candidatus Hydrogenedentota bacterium]HOH41632.1 tol-pal system protein YbgF [Candidatus Hydrogenedentota bacterium]HOM46886.1 tol-pal system protein YbgF [Candidatus Hydrogenedentota bacterium]
MKNYYWFMLAAIIVITGILPGCETMGGNQMQTTVYDMHRRMVKLDRELDSSVSRLNESTATLIARTDQSDQQTRMLQGLLEENQAKLDALTRELASMKTTLYRHWNLTTSGAPAGPPKDVSAGTVTIEGAQTPAVTPPSAPAVAPASAPAETPAPAAPPAAAQTQTGKNEIFDSAPLPTETLTGAAQTAAPVQTAAEVPQSPAASDPRVLYQQAQRSFANEDYNTALRQFDEYLSQNPSSDLSANALFWKGKCLYSMDRYAESIQAFEQLRTNYGTSTKVPFAMHNQAVAHSRLGQLPEAARLMEAVIDQYPTSQAADQARTDLRKLRGE